MLSAAGKSSIGEPGRDVFALLFEGGGLNTAFQLGVVHALLVSEGRPPDVVVGISAGAINAAALAEILQADSHDGAGVPSARGALEQRRRAAQVARFREFLELVQEAPGALVQALLPDPYEVDAQRPLRPIELPIHYREERRDRAQASRERSGLIRLINHLLATRLRVKVITQVVHSLLSYAATANEASSLKRSTQRLKLLLRLWMIAAMRPFRIAPLIATLISAKIRNAWDDLLLAFAQRLRSSSHDFDRAIRWIDPAYRQRGFSAGRILAGSRLFRAAVKADAWLLRSTFSLLVIYAIPVTLIGLLLLFWQASMSLFGISRWAPPLPVGLWYLWCLAVLLVIIGASVVHNPAETLLKYYSLLDSLASNHPLRHLLARFFDPSYYGSIHLETMLASALAGGRSTSGNPEAAKRLDDYRRHPSLPIWVAPVAADVETGRLSSLQPSTPVVQSLLAATAVTPLFPAVELDVNGRKCHYIDGLNVAKEPTSALMDLLRENIDPDATRVRIYSVTSLPASRTSLAEPERRHSGLVAVIMRVLALKRCRDTYLDHRLTELFTKLGDLYAKLAPDGKPDRALQSVPGLDRGLLRADTHFIEPDQPIDLNNRVLHAEDLEARRAAILQTVAEGCRATLETMIQPAIPEPPVPGALSCSLAIKAHLGHASDLPGADLRLGPGLGEVCRACPLNQKKDPVAPSLRSWAERSTSFWPRPGDASRRKQPDPSPPKPDGAGPPQVAVLFSGGVFRGVFQMGVVTGLTEALHPERKPDLFAGASVGSITAAMGAKLFESSGEARRKRLSLLAATYLTLDRLVLTDRFADFVRKFTLRAGATEFSVSDADRLFRLYDRGAERQFNRQARKVVAGLERLFYLTPFELLQLVRDLRLGHTTSLAKQLSEILQYFLGRFEVGQEILGSEPLALLIQQHVLSRPDRRLETFREFGESSGIALLAVACNLTLGRLDVLPALGRDEKDSILIEALLASSAFPGVFRPRWSWEVLPRTAEICQYTDGGVMDNLPLDAVVEHLACQANERRIARRPVSAENSVPHLLFTASLEPRLSKLENAAPMAASWLRLQRRAKRLSYNRKADRFKASQRRFRTIYDAIGPQAGAGHWAPLDVEVVTVKPEWLCSTFGFHPMLGFSRKKQAENIAHGCASTLGTLWTLGQSQPHWLQAWGMGSVLSGDHEFLQETVEVIDTDDLEIRLSPENRKEPPQAGHCWFRRDAECPFSSAPADPDIRRELRTIYDYCGRNRTHRSAEALRDTG